MSNVIAFPVPYIVFNGYWYRVQIGCGEHVQVLGRFWDEDDAKDFIKGEFHECRDI